MCSLNPFPVHTKYGSLTKATCMGPQYLGCIVLQPKCIPHNKNLCNSVTHQLVKMVAPCILSSFGHIIVKQLDSHHNVNVIMVMLIDTCNSQSSGRRSYTELVSGSYRSLDRWPPGDVMMIPDHHMIWSQGVRQQVCVEGLHSTRRSLSR